MTPPPADPIRPLGPVSGDMYVGPAEYLDRVQRRHRDETPEEQRRRRRQQHPPKPGQAWIDPGELDAGTYDDHGRAHHRDEDPPAHPHVDATA